MTGATGKRFMCKSFMCLSAPYQSLTFRKATDFSLAILLRAVAARIVKWCDCWSVVILVLVKSVEAWIAETGLPCFLGLTGWPVALWSTSFAMALSSAIHTSARRRSVQVQGKLSRKALTYHWGQIITYRFWGFGGIVFGIITSNFTFLGN